MLFVYLLVCIFAEDGRRGEYLGVLDRYQLLLKDHEQCVDTLADSRAKVRSYENLIVNGLQQQVATLQKELKDTLSQQEEIKKSLKDLKEKDESIVEKIGALKTEYAAKQASSYFIAKTKSTIPLNIPIPLAHGVIEHESGFDGSTGIMTVKIPGTYFWNCQFLTHHMSVHLVLLLKRGTCVNDVSDSHNNQKDGHYMVTLMTTLVLEQNDKVWVEMRSGRLYTNSGADYNQCTAFKIA